MNGPNPAAHEVEREVGAQIEARNMTPAIQASKGQPRERLSHEAESPTIHIAPAKGQV